MSAETDYLRAELNSAKASLNSQSLRIIAVKAIDDGLSLLDSRDALEKAGVALPDMDVSIVGAIYDPIKTSIDARNAGAVAMKSKATILSELEALSVPE